MAYGRDSEYLNAFFLIPDTLPETAVRQTLAQKIQHLDRIIEGLETLVEDSISPLRGKRIFIGHGRSLIWLVLKDFIVEQLGLPVDEFNQEEVAGMTIVEHLETMLSQAAFAFLIMTAEDEQTDGSYRARQNVVHEGGLFQGKLNFRRAIVMIEEECAEFSNITGLSQIRFPHGDIAARFENVRNVLRRESLI